MRRDETRRNAGAEVVSSRRRGTWPDPPLPIARGRNRPRMLPTLKRIGIFAAVPAVMLSADAAKRVQASPAERIGGAAEVLTNPSVQSGAGLASCLAWSDGCVTCQRNGDAVACSNIGIACH